MWTSGQPVQGICPKNWHIPNADDWTELFQFLGAQLDKEYDSKWFIRGSENTSASVKLVKKSHLSSTNKYFNDPDLNITGFGADNIGYGQEVASTFSHKDDYIAYFWSSSSLGKSYDQDSESWRLRNDLRHAVRFDRIPSLDRLSFDPKSISYYFPCRCVKD
jgi:uncharacterized protein (TIGR02145 family)